jgi:Tol biopolymer transport system component
MALTSGTRLGPYEILALVGSGGMGEVYRATDTRLGRTLAIKVLPAQVADHPERRQRFEREARTVASLNHPHICALHDIGHDCGIDFLVLEYLEVHTLAERLIKGPLPLDQVLRHAIEIADALDHAHRHGVVHRDLKPANIMLTKSGVKVLDFGLAKLRAVDSLPAVSTVATGRAPLTAVDAILGTFQYMAPEQLEGREADTRSDIFALGTVVYEMATGRKAFEASTQAGAIGAILYTDPPPMASVQPTIPASLDRVIRRCLEKDPDDRWQTARDLMRELEWIAEAGSQPALPAASVGRRRSLEGLAWITAAFLAVSTLFLAVLRVREPPIEQRAVRLSVLPAQPTGDFTLSPDGRLLAFVAGSERNARLWIQPLDSLTPQPLAGTEGAETLFWSPDSRFIAFGAGGKLKTVAVSGGLVRMLCDAESVKGGTWNRDDMIVFAPNQRTPLYRVAAAGGDATPLTMLDRSRGQNTHRWPHFLPDGRHFLYLARSSRPENNGIYIGSLDSTSVTRLMTGQSQVVYTHPGYLLFARDGALLAQPFDAKTLRIEGDSFQVLDDVRFTKADSYASFSHSDHGELAYQTSAAGEYSELAWFTRAGQRLESPVASGNVVDPSLAPDGKRVAVMRWADATSDIWLFDAARGSSSRLTFDPSIDYAPVWSPDGNTIVFGSNRDGPSDLYQASSSGVGDDKALLKSNAVKRATDWSFDGRLIVYESKDRKTDLDLWTLSVRGDRREAPYLQTEFAERLGRLAPNGRWMAYVSNESGRDEVYVRPFPLSSGKWQISTAGGTEPRWRRDGQELFYLAADQRLMAVPVQSSSRLEHGVPRMLFEARMIQDKTWGYDVTPDGQRFVVGLAVGGSPPAPINIVLNWAAALSR